MKPEFVPITEARAKIKSLVETANERDVVLVRHSRPAAYLVGAERYEAMIEELDTVRAELTALAARLGIEPTRAHEKVAADLGLIASAG